MPMKNIVVLIIIVALVGAGSFYAGMRYQTGKVQSLRGQFNQMNNSAQGQRGQFPQRQGQNGFRPVAGIILSRDDKSITVKLSDGSSKIVLITDNSSINKTETATADDLTVGENIMVFGQENSDGSITATNIQLNRGNFMQPGAPTGQ